MCPWDRKTPTVTRATDTQLCVLIPSYNWPPVREPKLNSELPTRDEGGRIMVTLPATRALEAAKRMHTKISKLLPETTLLYIVLWFRRT